MPKKKIGESLKGPSLYEQIYAAVRQIPSGRVATYGQIAKIVGRCGARTVGYAMASLPHGLDVPWHRVINAQGKVSGRAHGGGDVTQRQLLEQEGVQFDGQGRVNLKTYRWSGPDQEEGMD
ncbi:MAG: methylated-DNA--[protein]-cysteine S-methyltransferase [Deltaproteobacteria bacterium]|nr:methylated-DNA--[protein]-cysteine S-methyltransferase [Deltaproteobacteria bacterium]